MTDKAAIIAALRRLDPADLRELRTHIAARLDDDSAVESAAGDRIFSMICAELRRHGLVDASIVPFRRLAGLKKAEYAERADALLAFVRGQHKDRRVQDAILRAGLQLLIRHARERADNGGAPVTPQLICASIDRVPAHLDREFPGYAAAGLLHLIAGQAPPAMCSPPQLALVR